MICTECNDTGIISMACIICEGSGQGLYENTKCDFCYGKGIYTKYCTCEIGIERDEMNETRRHHRAEVKKHKKEITREMQKLMGVDNVTQN